MGIYSLCLLLILSLPVRTFFRKDFTSRVNSVLRQFGQLEHYSGLVRCIDVAHSKAQDQAELDSWDQYYAVILINMYSNPSCNLFETGNNVVFYKKVNKEMRSILPRGRESKLWLKVGTLINKAIELMGLKPYNVIYRGCANDVDFTAQEFTFRQITSTSTNPRVAEIYSGCLTFIQIQDVLGLNIERYSQVADESEILLQSTNVYFVEKHTRNETEIREEMESVAPRMGMPKQFVRLRQKHRNSRTFLSQLISCSFFSCRTTD